MMTKGFTHESTHNESKEWYTPRHIFKALGVEFDLDPCSPGQEFVSWIPAMFHHTVKEDGLMTKWFGKVFMNPPYGMDTPKWMKRLYEHGNGIALVFARTDTKWFHDYVPKADAICFIKGRIGFVPHDKSLLYADGQWQTQGGCGAASMLVAYGSEMAGALLLSGLGLTLPVSKNVETFRAAIDFAGGSRRPNENLPHISENRQRIINEANAQIRRNKK
ncbi:hypothetical protein LCGC14_0959090 [marine sediment metagenome]|uniref:DNA N-6-adenine-methyltransferase (Dam) n=1 Tax=marine sediment metagenome TaxID=412755 RepID=A0A0F9P133_9ZZZZ